MDKRFPFQEVEKRLIKRWEEAKIATPCAKEKSKDNFVMAIPPPNITGALHVGHALNISLQDFMLRFNMKKGKRVLWVPGTDHGGIATQYVVEQSLVAKGIDRATLSREDLKKALEEWAKKTKNRILEQFVDVGCLLDFSRTRFTMDETCSKAVNHAFIKLFNDRLIYKGERIINWCPRCASALSDLELEYEPKSGNLWHIKYPLVGKEGYLTVATTRPETMLGDSGIAVHPADERYKHLVGAKAILPLMEREIPIVADFRVDPKFGTGAVKVTPAHDPLDWDIGQDHKLETYKVIGEDGNLTAEAGKYQGLSAIKGRNRVIEDLAKKELLLKEEPYNHNVGVCYRCSEIVEPLTSKQWFLKMEPFKKLAIDAYKKGQPKFYPESWGKMYDKWLKGLKDWCLSRQIVWGHQIPVWYCKNEQCKPIASDKNPQKCPSCAGTDMEQEKDVLDTWFSSALWPMSVLGWPEKTQDFKTFFPTTVMVTGYEIIYLWVARMVMAGLYFEKKLPYKYVYIHGIVRDTKGRKMSKSLGNVVDPKEAISKFGTDTLRYSLLSACHPGRDIPFSTDSYIGAKNFVTKIWNAARFIKFEMDKIKDSPQGKPGKTSHFSDIWIQDEINQMIEYADKQFSTFETASGLKKIYETFWSKFCDWYLEIAKSRIFNGKGTGTQKIMLESMQAFMKMIEPAMPF
ncbi:valine--tRNA ligase, partial [Elusimicrobiota bacterium]